MMAGGQRQKVKAKLVSKYQAECIDMMIQAYQQAIEAKQLDRECVEDQITLILHQGFLETLKLEHRWHVNPQVPIYRDAYSSGRLDPARAPKPDLKFEKYFALPINEVFEFYIEAKNISESNWQKQRGAKVFAAKYQKRYINTGIDNFKSGRYPYGCLAAYVVQGDSLNIAGKLNAHLEKAGRKDEQLITHQTHHPGTMLVSYHNTVSRDPLTLHHLFFAIP